MQCLHAQSNDPLTSRAAYSSAMNSLEISRPEKPLVRAATFAISSSSSGSELGFLLPRLKSISIMLALFNEQTSYPRELISENEISHRLEMSDFSLALIGTSQKWLRLSIS
jgi:hypothetical protein